MSLRVLSGSRGPGLPARSPRVAAPPPTPSESEKSGEEGNDDDDDDDGNRYELLAAEDLDWWLSVFERHDRKGDGEVSTTDLGLLLRSIGDILNQAEITQVAKMADADGGGTIDFEEFCGLMIWRKRREQLAGLELENSPSRCLRLLHRLRAGELDLVLEPPDENDEDIIARGGSLSSVSFAPQRWLSRYHRRRCSDFVCPPEYMCQNNDNNYICICAHICIAYRYAYK